MLQSAKDLKGFTLLATDGEIGAVRALYFDDHRWTVRHLVVETGGWLSGRHVLVSPHAVRAVERNSRRLEVTLSRQQVQDAPGIEADRPVSRQQEAAVHDHYGYPYYWGGVGLWGSMDLPMGGTIAPFTPPDPGTHSAAAAPSAAPPGDPHLRSSAEVLGYRASATDGDIGEVDDLLFDTRSWQIDLLVIDTGRWLPGRRVLVAPRWVDTVDWPARRIAFQVPRRLVEGSPDFRPIETMGPDETRRIQLHFEGWE